MAPWGAPSSRTASPATPAARATSRIPVLAQDLLGIHPRKVCYFPGTGSALVKRLPHAHDDALVKAEKDYQRTLAKAIPAGGVELFD